MGSKLLFRFRSGTHAWFKLGRHNTRGVSKACVLRNCECESVEHVLWECSAYSNIKSVFINSLRKILYSDFHLKSSLRKLSLFSIRVFRNVMVTLPIGS